MVLNPSTIFQHQIQIVVWLVLALLILAHTKQVRANLKKIIRKKVRVEILTNSQPQINLPMLKMQLAQKNLIATLTLEALNQNHKQMKKAANPEAVNLTQENPLAEIIHKRESRVNQVFAHAS